MVDDDDDDDDDRKRNMVEVNEVVIEITLLSRRSEGGRGTELNEGGCGPKASLSFASIEGAG